MTGLGEGSNAKCPFSKLFCNNCKLLSGVFFIIVLPAGISVFSSISGEGSAVPDGLDLVVLLPWKTEETPPVKKLTKSFQIVDMKLSNGVGGLEFVLGAGLAVTGGAGLAVTGLGFTDMVPPSHGCI